MAVISDAAAYFIAVREAILLAQRTVFMLGWDFDTRIKLAPNAPSNDAPADLGSLLAHAVQVRPDLDIYLLRWDLALLKMPFRGRTPLMLLDWITSNRLHFRLDGKHPPASCHHQKIVVIDDLVAFCGGIDLTSDRWDTPEHTDDNPYRIRPGGTAYPPWHDATTVLEGEAARSLGELARQRWRFVTGENIPQSQVSGPSPWPQSVLSDFVDVDVGISRTQPRTDEQEQVSEIETLYIRAISSAEKCIYIETQYFACSRIADELCKALEKPNGPEIILINPESSEGWLEEVAMGSARAVLLRRLNEKDRDNRLRCYWPATAGGKPIYVHAKILVVDDTFLRVGSSNLNNRSMGLDTECDISIEAATTEERRQIQNVRDRFIAEHLGVQANEVRAVLEGGTSMIQAIERLSKSYGRRLVPLEAGDVIKADIEVVESRLLDPKTPEQMSVAFRRKRWPIPSIARKLLGF